MIKRTLEELNLIDDFLMNCVATDPEVSEPFFRKLLSVLLQRDIGRVRVTAQPIIPGNDTTLRGIRMDVEVDEAAGPEGDDSVANVYDIEPHTKRDQDFPRHNRFYQAKIDSRHLKSGVKDFAKLPNLYIITITNFDVFMEDYMMYTFRNSCVELPQLEYDDGLCYVYFNTTGKKGGSQSIKNMLNYIQRSAEESVADEATGEIDAYVKRVKANPALQEGIMTLGDYFDQERQDTMVQCIVELLEDIGPVPDDLRRRLEQITDLDELSRLHKVAAHAGSIAGFEEAMQKESVVA